MCQHNIALVINFNLNSKLPGTGNLPVIRVKNLDSLFVLRRAMKLSRM